MPRPFRHRWPIAVAVGLAAACAPAVALSGPSQNARADATGAGDLAYAKAQVAKATAIPKFTAPGPAFNAGAAKGKTVFLIPQTSAVRS